MTRSSRCFSRFLILWAGQLFSKMGSGISAFALGITLFQQTGSTSAYAFLLLAAFLPAVLLAPIGGVIADRRDRRRLMIIGDLGAALGIVLIIGLRLRVPELFWPLYLGVGLSSLFGALHSPAFKASITDLLDKEAYARASGLIQLAEASRYLLSPFLAVFLLARFSLPLVLAIDALTFIAAALTVLAIRKTDLPGRTSGSAACFSRDLREGLRYLIHQTELRHLLWLTTLVTFFTGILQTLFVPTLLSLADAAAAGTIQSIAASGMLISSLLIGLWSHTNQQQMVLRTSLYATGVFYVLIGISPTPVLLTVTAFGLFCTLPFVNTSLEVLFRQGIPAELQGRLWSLIALLSQIGMLAAFSVTGLLADHLFTPLLTASRFSDTLTQLVGAGPGRGNALMVTLCGGCFLLTTLILFNGGRRKRNEQRVFPETFPEETSPAR